MKKLFNLNFYNGDEVQLIKEVIGCEGSAIIFTPNIDHIIKISIDKELFSKYSQANFIIADGWPVALTGRLKGMDINRITGVDLMDRLIDHANKQNENIFFLGAEESTLSLLVHNIRSNYSNIGHIGTNNGYFKNSEKVIENINKCNTDILFVGMGCPKQERWIIDNKDKLNCKIIIAVGGAFRIYSGEIKRAPKWIQNIGLEWFFRFVKEPKRLFKRYFIDYVKFIPIFLKELANKTGGEL